MNLQTKRRLMNLSGLWLALLAAAFVIGWREWVVAHKPAHMLEMAEELGWIAHYREVLYPNNSNTALVFCQTTDNGEGIFFCNGNNSPKKLICEQMEKGWCWQSFGAIAWAPDDSLFACSYPPRTSGQPPEELLICDGHSGKILTKLPVDSKFSRLAWLSSSAFAYFYVSLNHNNLVVVQRKSDMEWVQTKVLKGLGANAKNLVATSENSLAWKDGNQILSLQLADATPKQIYEATTNTLVDFTFSMKTKEFLLNCAQGPQQSLVRFYPPTGWSSDLGIIGNQTNAIRHVGWFNDGIRYATVDKGIGGSVFHIKTSVQSPPVDLPWPGLVMNYTMNGDCLYVTGDLTSQPPGIFQYNLASKETACFVSALDHPLKYAKIVGAINGSLTNSAGRLVHYFLWPPVNLSAHKKHPLIIGQTTYSWWLPYPQIAANTGSYFVFIDRPSWWGGLENWKDDVMQIHDLMVQDPNVDADQVYLYGTSAETGPLSELLTEQSDLWQGALLFNPTATPDPATVHISQMLVLDGTDDGANAVERWANYQNKAAEQGIMVKLALIDGAQHMSHSTRTEHTKTEQVARFLFGD